MHDTSVPWSDQFVDELTKEQLANWRCWTKHLDDSYWIQYAKGPCPGCGETAQGYTTNKPGPVELVLAEAEGAKPQVKVPVNCECGFAHGQKDAKGCGRDWVVVCELEPREDASSHG